MLSGGKSIFCLLFTGGDSPCHKRHFGNTSSEVVNGVVHSCGERRRGVSDNSLTRYKGGNDTFSQKLNA